ncbi:MAG TPA: hypothetical protein VF768_08025, partial [Holophagaceae bacterium]
AARQRAGGEFLAYEAEDHVYDLSPSGHRTSLRLPWDGDRYRLSLRPEQGRVPRILGLRAWAETPPVAISPHLQEDAALAPVAGRPGSWRVSLGAPDRITGLEVVLAPPAAPLRVEVCPAQGEGGPLASALLWNLPALGSRATRVDLPPTLAQDLLLRLPEGAQPVSVKVRLHREALLFPAEKGVAYCLHLGGEAKPAPGDLGALPSSRLLLAAEPLGLGPEHPDPDGLPRRVDAAARSRPWIPWVAGLAILGLGVVAWRLLREGRDPV